MSRQIGVFVRPDASVKRDLLRSIANECLAHADHEVLLIAPLQRGADFEIPREIDGVIAWPDHLLECDALRGCGKPVVFVGHMDPGPGTTRVSFDNRAIGRLAAEALLERGFTRFGVWAGRMDHNYGRDRVEGFVERVLASGSPPPSIYRETGDDADELGRLQEQEDWLRRLPTPVAVFCDIDRAGSRLLRVCKHLRLRVPEDISVVSVGDDDLLCDLTQPRLSSYSLRGQDAGRRALSLLRSVWSKPRSVVHEVLADFPLRERGSLSLSAMEDRVVADAVRWIRDHVDSVREVGPIARAVGVSRRTLELRVKKTLGRTPAEEIARARLARARELLESTNLPVGEVADLSGYREPQRLCEAFAQAHRQSPTSWRAQRRAGG